MHKSKKLTILAFAALKRLNKKHPLLRTGIGSDFWQWQESEVDRVAFGGEGGLVDDLGHGRVRVDGRVDVLGGEFLVERQAHFGDEFGGIFTDDVSAQQFAVFFAVEQFGKSFGFTGGDGFADGGERNLADGVFDASFLEGALGFADGGDLWVAIGATREVVYFAWRVTFEVETFDSLYCLEGSGVCEPWGTGDITCGINARDRGLVAGINVDVTALAEGGLDAAGQDGLHTNGDEADIGNDGFGGLGTLDGNFDVGAAIFGGGDLGVGEATNSLFDEGFFERVTDFVVFDGKHARQHFHDGDFGAEGIVDVGEFNTDRACADDHHRLRLLRQDHGFFRANNGGAVVGKGRKRTGFASGGDQDVSRVEHLLAAIGGGDFDFSRGGDRAEATNVVDFVFLEQILNAACETIGHLA